MRLSQASSALLVVFTTAVWILLNAPQGYAQQTKPNVGKLYGAMPTVYPDWFKESFLDFADDVSEAAERGKRLMVLFHQDGCPYCNALVERNLSQKHIEGKVRQHFDVVAINMWGDREVITVGGQAYDEKGFAKALRVQFTPTILFFNESGKLALRVNGYLPPHRFEVALDYVIEKKETEVPYRDYVAMKMPVAANGELNTQEFFSAPPYDLKASNAVGRPIAVFFEQKQCPNCDTLHTRTIRDPQTLEIVKRFTCVQLDMWSDTPIVTPSGENTTAREWAAKLDVKYAPSIVLFSPEGEEIIRSEAVFKVFHTQSIFDYVLSGGYKHERSFQRYISARAKHIRAQGQDVNIWQ